MSVLSKSKKTSTTEERPELFYIDEKILKSQDKAFQPTLNKMTAAKGVFERVVGEKITSYEAFQEMVKDPAGYFQKIKAEDNIQKKKPVTMALIEEGYSFSMLQDHVELPADFHEVIECCNAVLKEKPEFGNFAFDGKEFSLSARLVTRMYSKVYFYATTDLQKRRLALANKFLDLLPEWEELLRDECEQMQIPKSKVESAIASKKFLGPLMYCLKLDRPVSNFWGDPNIKANVQVNEFFVTEGHKPYAEIIGLPGLKPLVKMPKYEDKTLYRRFTRIGTDGLRRPGYVRKGEEAAAYSGFGRESDVRFDDNEYRLMDGKFVLAEQK